MKKSLVILLAIPTLVLTGCKNSKIDTSKIALDYGYYRNEQIHSWTEFEDLDYDNLDALMTTKESFVLLTYHNLGCDCWTTFAPLAVQFANEYHCDFRTLDVALLSGHSNKFGIYSGTGLMPGIVFIRRGKVIRQTIYGKIDANERQMFKEYVYSRDSSKGFKPFMLKNVYLPKMYYIEKDLLDNKINNNDDFSLYIARAGCGDCKAINYDTLYKWNDKNKVTSNKIYIFNIDPYYASKPREGDEDYEEKMIKYNAYLAFKTSYGLSEEGSEEFGFGTGYVPTFQKRIGSTITDMITVLNDSADENNVVTSFFNQTRIANSPILRDTGTTYLYDGKVIDEKYITPWGSIDQELQLKWHGPIVNLFFNSYVK